MGGIFYVESKLNRGLPRPAGKKCGWNVCVKEWGGEVERAGRTCDFSLESMYCADLTF